MEEGRQKIEEPTCSNCGNAEGAVCYYSDGNEGVSTLLVENGWCKNWKEFKLTLDSGNFLE